MFNPTTPVYFYHILIIPLLFNLYPGGIPTFDGLPNTTLVLYENMSPITQPGQGSGVLRPPFPTFRDSVTEGQLSLFPVGHPHLQGAEQTGLNWKVVPYWSTEQ